MGSHLPAATGPDACWAYPSRKDRESAALHQFDRMLRADPHASPAPYAVIGVHLIMPAHVQENDRTHVAELGTGATMLAQIHVDQRAVGRDGILPVRLVEFLMGVVKME